MSRTMRIKKRELPSWTYLNYEDFESVKIKKNDSERYDEYRVRNRDSYSQYIGRCRARWFNDSMQRRWWSNPKKYIDEKDLDGKCRRAGKLSLVRYLSTDCGRFEDDIEIFYIRYRHHKKFLF